MAFWCAKILWKSVSLQPRPFSCQEFLGSQHHSCQGLSFDKNSLEVSVTPARACFSARIPWNSVTHLWGEWEGVLSVNKNSLEVSVTLARACQSTRIPWKSVSHLPGPVNLQEFPGSLCHSCQSLLIYKIFLVPSVTPAGAYQLIRIPWKSVSLLPGPISLQEFPGNHCHSCQGLSVCNDCVSPC